MMTKKMSSETILMVLGLFTLVMLILTLPPYFGIDTFKDVKKLFN